MTTKEFLDKWERIIIGSQQKPASQLIVDFVEDNLDKYISYSDDDNYSDEFLNKDVKDSIAYEVGNLLEICDKEIPTYPILLEMQKDLE